MHTADQAPLLARSAVCFITLPRSSLILIYLSHLRCGNAPLDHLPLNRITTMRKRFRSVSLPDECPWTLLVDCENALSRGVAELEDGAEWREDPEACTSGLRWLR